MDQYEVNPPDGGYGWIVLGKFYTNFIFNYVVRIQEIVYM